MAEIPIPTERAQKLALTFKKRMNSSEGRVWGELKKRWPDLFWPQVAFGPYIADFLSTEQALCIEVDGVRHAERTEHDARRDAFFRANDFRVLRIPCDDVWQRLEQVIDLIGEAVGKRVPMKAGEVREKKRKRVQRKKKRMETQVEKHARAPWLPDVFASPEVLEVWRANDPPRKRQLKPKGRGVTRLAGHPGIYSPPKPSVCTQPTMKKRGARPPAFIDEHGIIHTQPKRRRRR